MRSSQELILESIREELEKPLQELRMVVSDALDEAAEEKFFSAGEELSRRAEMYWRALEETFSDN